MAYLPVAGPAGTPAGGGVDVEVLVVLPAHNEAALIGAALGAVVVAARRVPEMVGVAVVLDACTDTTAVLAARFGVAMIEVAGRNVGAARAAGMAAAGPRTAWLATTDADSRVPADWLVRQLAHARRGAGVALGTVLVDDWQGHAPGIRERFMAEYGQPGAAVVGPAALTPHQSGHGHIHGANLGVTADWYGAVGGFRALPVHEDVDLVRRLVGAGAPVVWDADNPVQTSARLDTRAPDGFGATLRRLGEPA